MDPQTRLSIALLRYERAGDRGDGLVIASHDEDHQRDVEEVLALNSGDLPDLRAKAGAAFLELCKKEGPKGVYGKPARRAYFPTWRARQGARLPEFIAVIEALL